MTKRTLRRNRILAGGVAALFAMTGLSAIPAISAAADGPDLSTCPWMDVSKTSTERANLLLAASTQSQKYRWLNEQSANTPSQTVWTASGVTTTYDAALPCTPVVVYTDGPDGIRSQTGVTAFPSPIANAATWNRALSYDKGAAIAAEGFDKRKNGVLGPGISNSRTPLAGRTPEYLGEDSLLSGLLGADITNGLQLGNPDKPVLTSIKHYVANEQELTRQTSSSNVDEQTLHQVYDLPYEVLEANSDPASVMCSYNQINGVYACENPILTTNLKGSDIGFTGYVVSDFGAVHSTAQALMGGLDQELNRPKFFTPALLNAALDAGTITQARIDEAAFRVVNAYISVGLFDKPLKAAAKTVATTPAHQAISQDIAEQGSVLLKNAESALPLKPTSGQTIALIGPTASATVTGGVSAKNVCSMGAVGRSNTMSCDGLIAPDTAITARAAQDGATVTSYLGTDPTAAAAAADAADVAIVFGYQRMGEFNDITDLHLQNGGDAVIAAVAASNAKKVIVVLETGSAVEMPWLADVDGVVEAWYPGDQQGPALSRLLFGDSNFSGKLPMTFPKSLTDTPTAASAAQYPGVTRTETGSIVQVDYTEGLEVGYKWYDEQNIDPLFEFGYGLSYTDFDYSDLSVSSSSNAETGAVTATATFTVTNTGSVSGAEIPQVYLTLPDSADDPGKRLVGFDRVSLGAGKSTTVSVDVSSAAADHPFGMWDTTAHAWTNVAGNYTFSVGSSSRDLPLTESQSLDFDGVAPTVTVTPTTTIGASGWYTAPVALTVSAVDDTDATPAVEVSVDNAGWVDASAGVTVSGDGSHSVQARATDDSGNVSSVSTSTIKIDATKPQVTASSSSTAHTVTLQAADATSGIAKIEYSISGGAYSTYTGPIAAGRTATSISYRATDVAGNVSSVATFAYVPSVSVPAVALTATPASIVFGASMTLTATVPTDAVGSVEFFDGSRSVGKVAVSNGIATKTVTLDAGTHRINASFGGDATYADATSMVSVVTVAKTVPTKISVTSKSFTTGTKPAVKVTVGKLNNGTWPVGKVTVYVSGKAVGSDKITASDHGKATVKLTKRHASSIKVVAKFVATDSDNVSGKNSKTTKLTAKK